MLPGPILELILEYKAEIDALTDVIKFLNGRYKFLGIDLDSRSDVDTFIEYTNQVVGPRNLTIHRTGGLGVGMWSWVSTSEMRILDILNFAGVQMCDHECLESIHIENNVVRLILRHRQIR
jgi:hypothetical protein